MKYFTLKNEHSDFENTLGTTCLRSIDKELWEFDLMDLSEERIQNGFTNAKLNESMKLKEKYEYNKLNKNGFKQYIKFFEEVAFRKSNVENKKIEIEPQIEWAANDCEMVMSGGFAIIEKERKCFVRFACPNKYLAIWPGQDAVKEEINSKAPWIDEYYKPEWDGDDNSLRSFSLSIKTEILEQYIADLITEYQQATGENYESLYLEITKLKNN